MIEMSSWPQHNSPAEALRQETSNWGERLEVAKRRYDHLDGELGASATRLAISIVDANEAPENFSMFNVYGQLFDDDTSAALLLVNYDDKTPPERTEQLVAAIQQQLDETNVQAAISVVGYHERRFDSMRQNVWDIAAVHGLCTGADTPIVGVSNDADLRGGSASYWRRMTRNEHLGQPARMWGSKVVPETYGSPDAIVNRLVQYLFVGRGLMTDVTGTAITYGASTATTLDTFVSTKGWVGSLTDQSKYGGNEAPQLALNIMERASGSPVVCDIDNAMRAIRTHVHSVPDDGFITVSGRRETVEYATYLAEKPYPMDLIDTRADNAFRRLTTAELAALAESTKPRTERVQEEIARLEAVFTRGLDEDTSHTLGVWLRIARESLDLPEPA